MTMYDPLAKQDHSKSQLFKIGYSKTTYFTFEIYIYFGTYCSWKSHVPAKIGFFYMKSLLYKNFL